MAANRKGKPRKTAAADGPVRTLWDEYAMAALTGVLANPSNQNSAEDSADVAGQFADLMMARRERTAAEAGAETGGELA